MTECVKAHLQFFFWGRTPSPPLSGEWVKERRTGGKRGRGNEKGRDWRERKERERVRKGREGGREGGASPNKKLPLYH